jgi:hypothetical protein
VPDSDVPVRCGACAWLRRYRTSPILRLTPSPSCHGPATWPSSGLLPQRACIGAPLARAAQGPLLTAP